MIGRFLSHVREQIRHQELIILGLIAGLVLLQIPVQHQISIARIQHHAISIAAVALGFALQLVLSWRQIGRWGRLSMAASAVALGALADYFWCNPWLSNLDLATENQMFEMRVTISCMGAFMTLVCFSWIRWGYEKRQGRQR